ncbi:hypothetical protein OF83DRAFT_666347 [Amylostereum chailletii]|nr:hypothetical protein OF83DRAFT_666347 [Amylostereum chailletii]
MPRQRTRRNHNFSACPWQLFHRRFGHHLARVASLGPSNTPVHFACLSSHFRDKGRHIGGVSSSHHHHLWKTLGEAVSQSQVYRILLILVESGVLYCATWVVLLCFIRTDNHQAHFSIEIIIAQFTTLYPNSVVVLASLQTNAHKASSTAAFPGTGLAFASNSDEVDIS